MNSDIYLINLFTDQKGLAVASLLIQQQAVGYQTLQSPRNKAYWLPINSHFGGCELLSGLALHCHDRWEHAEWVKWAIIMLWYSGF